MGSSKKIKRPTYPPEWRQANRSKPKAVSGDTRRVGAAPVPIPDDEDGEAMLIADWFDSDDSLSKSVGSRLERYIPAPAFVFVREPDELGRDCRTGQLREYEIVIQSADRERLFSLKYAFAYIRTVTEGNYEDLIEFLADPYGHELNDAAEKNRTAAIVEAGNVRLHRKDVWVSIGLIAIDKFGNEVRLDELMDAVRESGVKRDQTVDFTTVW